MHHLRTIIYILIASLSICDHAQSRTWHVDKDGSGDFTVIQPALDAASPGDTILIGPGRFTETELVTTMSWTEEVYAAVWTDSVSIIGSGVDVTIIGPEYGGKQFAPRPKGIFGAVEAVNGRIEQLTIENIRDGVFWNRSVIISSCSITGGTDGVIVFPGGGVFVENVDFNSVYDHGIIVFGAEEVNVINCRFVDGIIGLSVVGAGDVVTSSCRFEDQVVGLQYDGTNGNIHNCTFMNIGNACVVSYSSSVEMTDSVLSPSGIPIVIGSFSNFVGSGNVVEGGYYATIELSGSTLDFQGNHILNGGGMSIYLNTFLSDPPYLVDLSDNYWGTSEADSISAWIHDGHDDPDIHAFVVFEPYSGFPISNTDMSWGALKQIYSR